MANDRWGSAFLSWLFCQKNKTPRIQYMHLALELQEDPNWPPRPSTVTHASTSQSHLCAPLWHQTPTAQNLWSGKILQRFCLTLWPQRPQELAQVELRDVATVRGWLLQSTTCWIPGTKLGPWKGQTSICNDGLTMLRNHCIWLTLHFMNWAWLTSCFNETSIADFCKGNWMF